MNIKHAFLAAASTAALSFGIAHASDLSVGDATATADGSPVILASELEDASVSGTVSLLLNTVGTLPSDTNLKVTIDLTGGATFSTNLSGAEVTAGNDTIASENAIVSTGGTTNQDTVTYVIDPAIGETSLGFVLPINFAGCDEAPVSATATLVTVDDTVIENGGNIPLTDGVADGVRSGENAEVLINCADSLSFTVTSDEATNDSFLELDEDFSDFGVVSGASDQLTTPVGFIGSTLTGNALELDGSPVFSVADIDDIDVVLSFEDITNIDESTTTIAGSTGVVAGDSILFTLSYGAFPWTIIIGADGGGDTIESQTPSISAITANLNDGNADLVPSTMEATGPLDFLQLEGQNFGDYDWNRDDTGSINHVYRITGLPQEDVDGVLTLSNSSNDMDGVYPFTIPADAIENGVVLATSRMAATDIIGGSFGTGDFLWTFFVDDPLDVDRGILSNGTFADFGDCGNDSCASAASSSDDGEF